VKIRWKTLWMGRNRMVRLVIWMISRILTEIGELGMVLSIVEAGWRVE
jgi:hypothetical protein